MINLHLSKELAVLLRDALKRDHAWCEDCWYTCPKHEESCSDESGCNCGADSFNEGWEWLRDEIAEKLNIEEEIGNGREDDDESDGD